MTFVSAGVDVCGCVYTRTHQILAAGKFALDCPPPGTAVARRQLFKTVLDGI